MLVMNGVHNIVRQTYILKKNVEISTLSKGITHGRGFESKCDDGRTIGDRRITHGRGFESEAAEAQWLFNTKYHPRTWV